ncbi:hypothetical protein QWZ13_19315 [Reinekea marina]|uniref:Lipoprotein n=1 Tax=Reinekea marina TaxID=1310421 RepID=A0ABV7WR28_9GAMM|nr:hypothetical protein [Reinekea marina]MDN3647309.1 hypothetical protein [Reinekea marina]MDN3651065.1 hypothetical protein [Reinekea marina]
MANVWLHIKSLLAYLAIGCLMLSCSSRSLNTEMTRCVYPDSPRTPAPAFVCDPQMPGYPVTQLRQSPLSDASVDERIRHVYEDQIMAWSNEWANQWYRLPNSRQAALEWLQKYLDREARVIRSRVSPKGELWLLIGLPENDAFYKARFEKEKPFK